MVEEQINSAPKEPEKQQLRVALLASERIVSNYSIFLEHLLVGLSNEPIPAALVCPANYDSDSAILPAVEVIKHPALNIPFMGFQNIKILTGSLEQFKPTVLHCLCHSQSQLAKKLAKKLAVPYILTVHSLLNRRKQLFISTKRLSKLIVPAQSIAANMTGIQPKLAGRTEVINMGSFTEDCSSCFSRPGKLANVVVAASFDRADDFASLLAAVRHLAIDGFEFMLVIIGTGRAESALRKLLAEQGLSQITTLISQVRSWRPILAASDIFISPQPSNTFDPVLLEAMSVGTAVAGCKGGVDDLIIDGRTALVFDPDDELSIYSCLQRLFSRPEFARQLANQAQQYVRENHSVSNMISSIIQTYRQASL